MMSEEEIVKTKSRQKPEVSIVIPAFNEDENILKLYKEILKVLSPLNLKWEIIFSDDGSNDKTWDIIKSLCKQDKNIKGLRLSRNFGHQYALFAGLCNAEGSAIISMDADLQHPPELIPKLLSEWKKGNKVVQTIREPHKTGFIKKTTSALFYKIFSFLSSVKIESGMADFRLLDRQVLDNIIKFREEGLFLRGIVNWVGFPSSNVEFQCQERYYGKSKYTLKKMTKLATSGITSFSIVPLRIGILLGIFTSLIAFGELVYAIFAKIVMNTTVPGWASAVSIISFLFGILFILLGLIGEYIGKITVEVRTRPRFIIKEHTGFINLVKDDFRTRE